MIKVNPYIYFNGNCEEAFHFYAEAFRTEISHMEHFRDVPEASRHMFKEADEKIIHATLSISKETMLNGSDNSLAYEVANNYKTFSLIIHVDSKEEVDRLFDKLSQDGQIQVPAGLTFWGAYYGQCIDQFGINWKIILQSES